MVLTAQSNSSGLFVKDKNSSHEVLEMVRNMQYIVCIFIRQGIKIGVS